MNLDAMTDALSHSPLVRNIDRVPKGHARIQTGFYYPDGSSIDVFIPVQDQLALAPPKLTDFGNTISYLDNLLIKPYRQPRRREIMEKIMSLHGCEYNQGMIEYQLKGQDKTDFEHGIINLGQACARLSDLVFNARYRSMNDFNAEIMDRLSVTEYEVDQDYEIPRNSGQKSLRLNFLVKGKQRETGILTLSSADATSANIRANDIYVRWDDIDLHTDWRGNKVTLYNDAYAYDPLIMEHLSRKSTLVAGNDNETLLAILDAA